LTNAVFDGRLTEILGDRHLQHAQAVAMTSPTQAALVGFSLAAVSLVLTAQAQTASGEAVRHVPVKKLFPYYDLYLGLPPQDRDGFYLEYLIQSAGDAAPRQGGGTRINAFGPHHAKPRTCRAVGPIHSRKLCF